MGKYTAIDDPSAHFQTATWSGNAGTQSITNDGNSDLQPDWVWTKSRSDSSLHLVTDSTRGTGKRIYPSSTAAEESHSNMVTAFNSDGFSIGNHSAINTNGYNYVGWQWKANGGTTSSNGDGGITSTVQANTTAGFSIATYTGNSNNPSSIGHGLGVVPKFYVIRQRNGTNAWKVWHSHLAATDPEDYVIELNTTGARENNTIWNDTGPTSSVINFTDHGSVNQSGDTYVCYAFAEKQGYSKFSGYTGNGNSNGPFVYTGFKPAFVMIKRTDDTGGWTIYDTKRGFNGNNYELFPHSAEAEYTGTSYFEADILSNGFKLRLTDGQINASSGTYVYAAFAESPFVTSTGIMGTAR
jgi:hypothetical protein